jgi:hypothetical protein
LSVRPGLRADRDVDGLAGAGRVTGSARSDRRRHIASAAVCGMVLAIVAMFWTARYQPLDGGAGLNVETYQFPGMPHGLRPQPVNTFGNLRGELYLPPQRGVMTLAVTIRNNGPAAVTIDSVSIDRYLPLAGKPRYLDVGPSPKAVFLADRGPVTGTALQPGRTIVVGIPVHVPNCVNKTAAPYVMVSSILVREHFLVFTHTAAIPIPTPLIWQAGSASAASGTACAN